MAIGDLAPRQLFGGAIQADLPTGLIDASDLRQVPDNQEVLLSRTSSTTHILEVLEAVDRSDLQSIAEFHFSSLAHDNDAVQTRILSVAGGAASTSTREPSTTPAPITLTGLQTIKKFTSPSSPLDLVLIHVAIWRLSPHKNVDLVLSCNEPLIAHDDEQDKEGSEAQSVEEQERIRAIVEGSADVTTSLGSQAVREQFNRTAKSLTIKDWSLFA